MNRRLILFAGLVSSAIGVVIGLAVAEMAAPDYQSQLYQDAHRKYAIVGAVAGALVGAGQEAVRQLKQQQDRREGTGSKSNAASDTFQD